MNRTIDSTLPPAPPSAREIASEIQAGIILRGESMLAAVNQIAALPKGRAIQVTYHVAGMLRSLPNPAMYNAFMWALETVEKVK